LEGVTGASEVAMGALEGMEGGTALEATEGLATLVAGGAAEGCLSSWRRMRGPVGGGNIVCNVMYRIFKRLIFSTFYIKTLALCSTFYIKTLAYWTQLFI
jgi:hypothetical protein